MTKTFMTKLLQHSMLLALVLSMGWFATPSQATLACATPTLVAGGAVFPGLCDGVATGTLLASTGPEPWTLNTNLSSGTLWSAVYRQADGTLDFYYQIANSATCPAGPPCDPVERTTDINFSGFTTATGYRTDCGAFGCGAGFTDGTTAPFTADRPTNSTVGFNFALPTLDPGFRSNVMIISTNATNYTTGVANVIDGGIASVAAFAPTNVPEPMSIVLLGTGLVGLGLLRRRNKKA